MSRVIGMRAGDVTHAEMLRMRLISASQEDGVSPTQFFELLEAFVNEKAWKELGISFVDLIKKKPPVGMGLEADDFRKLLELKHRYEDRDKSVKERMVKVRGVVKDHLNPELTSHGTNQHAEDMILSCPPQGTSESYAVRRLKRDRPDLAEEVIGGRMSANAAAIRAGFRPRTATFYPEDLTRTTRALLKHFTPDELIQAIREDSGG